MIMKRFILWLIKIFRVDIPTEKIVEKMVEKEVYLPQNGVVEGDVTIKGNILIKGNLVVEGSLTINKEI